MKEKYEFVNMDKKGNIIDINSPEIKRTLHNKMENLLIQEIKKEIAYKNF